MIRNKTDELFELNEEKHPIFHIAKLQQNKIQFLVHQI